LKLTAPDVVVAAGPLTAAAAKTSFARNAIVELDIATGYAINPEDDLVLILSHGDRFTSLTATASAGGDVEV